jgi:guanine deaminase
MSTELLRAPLFHTVANPFRDDRALVCHEDGALLVRDGRIAASGDYDTVRADNREATVVDWRGGVLLPGLIDTHVHFPQVRILGGFGLTLLDWLDRLALPEEARMADEAYARRTAATFLHALASHGTTTALVFGAHFAPAMAAFFEAAAASGLRIASGLVLSDRLLPPELHRPPDEAYRESGELIDRFHGRGRLRYAVTPRFARSTSEAMLEVCQTLLREHDTVLAQTHINESPGEIAETARLFPWARDYVAVYERYGLAGPRAVLAHDVHVTASELERLAAARTTVAHCPASNAALGSGIFPLRRHLEAGVAVALGTDVGGGTGFGMLKEALQAYLMQRVAPDGMVLDPGHLLYLATLAGAEALGLEGEIGDFRAGKAADFVYLRPAPASPLEAILRHADSPRHALGALFMLAGPESVRDVRVAGSSVFRRDREPSG